MVTLWNKISSQRKIALVLISWSSIFVIMTASATFYLVHYNWLDSERNNLISYIDELSKKGPNEIGSEAAEYILDTANKNDLYWSISNIEIYRTGNFRKIKDLTLNQAIIQEIDIKDGHQYILTYLKKTDLGVIGYSDDVTQNILFERLMILIGGIVLLIAIIISIIMSRSIANRILQPLRSITQRVNNISLNNMTEKLNETGVKNDPMVILAATLNRMLSSLTSATDNIKQFNYNISHELRTPLAVILTNLQMAEKTNNIIKVKNAITEISALAQIVENLLFIAHKPENIKFTTIDHATVKSIIIQSIKNAANIHQDQNISSPNINISKNLKIKVNKTLFTDLLNNLIENSYKHNLVNGKIKIILNNSELIIKNDSQDLTPEQLKYIFQPFYKASDTVKKGYGIGMSIVKKIVTIHSWQIKITNADKQTITTITF